jgi:nucleoside-diphosphate-sugar epimerase
MQVLLTGGTGYIGWAVLRVLREHGHDVRAVVRSEESAKVVRDAGADAEIGDLADTAWLSGQLSRSDGAIHLAALGPDGDEAVISAVLEAYAGTAKSFVYTGGVWTWGDNPAITEESPTRPPALTAWRLEPQRRLLGSGLRVSIVSPGLVYGYGRGIPAGVLAAGPRTGSGALRLIGPGDQHWTTVHVDDLADLYVRVLEQAPGGEHYIAASGDNPTVREIAEALGGPVRPESAEETRARLGTGFADALLLDQQATGAKARSLGWHPTRPGIREGLDN